MEQKGTANGAVHVGRMKMQKTFTDAYIRKLNELCKLTECNKECDGIGWCKQVFESLYIPEKIKAEVRNVGPR